MKKAKRLFSDPRLKSIIDFSDLYPGCIFKTIIINTNFWIRNFYSATAKKSDLITVLGYDYHEFLRNLIADEWILEEYGGNGEWVNGSVKLPKFEVDEIESSNEIEESDHEELKVISEKEIIELQAKCAILSIKVDRYDFDLDDLPPNGCLIC